MNRRRDSVRRASRHRSAGRDDGSAATELVVVTPVLLAVAAAFLLGSELLLDQQQVSDAARGGVEAAVIAPAPAAAVWSAAAAASSDLSGDGLRCARSAVVTDTRAFRAGGVVGVSVSCEVLLPELALLHLPSQVQVSASKTAVLEPYRAVGP